jgi:GNAT superfamily N-acetyltransferase
MKIRFGTKEDVAVVGPVLKKSWLMHVDNEPGFINREMIENADCSEYFSNCFDDSGKSKLLVAEIDGEVAGFAKIDFLTLQKFFNETRILYVDDIYTMEEYRGKGVARFVLEEVEKFAKEQNINWLKARVYTFNEPAQKTFESAGFKDVYSEYFKIIK